MNNGRTQKSAWLSYSNDQKEKLEKLCCDYMDFISECKTERESVKTSIEKAQAHGYRNIKDLIARGEKLKSGDKVYAVNMDKALVLFQLGSDALEDGMNILGAHIDTCRLDVKQNPLYEDGGMAYFDTHYYGGIKKYQWVTLPLALHGVVIKKDGSKQEINIGEKPEDPVFCVSDLLIHLAQEQMKKDAATVIEGEALDILIANRPLDDKAKNAVKENVLKLLKNEYGLEEDDFLSAELCLVPAGRARSMGFDQSMILGYGHDDRVCAFTSLQAMLENDTPKRSCCCLLVDKEEIGSVGATGMRSRFFENTCAEILSLCGYSQELSLRRMLASSTMLSSDVSSAFDPLYAQAFDKKNVAYTGRGMVFNKFTGARGKSGSNDANAEFIAKLRKDLDDAGVNYQFSELGKVDLGGGGTIAYIMSLYGMQVVDCGVPVLSMHAPWEVVSKADVYEAYLGYKTFLKS
ncbi:MAG: aminopeptidase [Succinatimonas sp.]|nr:aminopeptidase [Succinatimonas sp.]